MPSMSSPFSLQIDDKALLRRMKRLSENGAFKKSELTKAMRPSAKVFQKQARAYAPKDSRRLARSIRIKTLKGWPAVLSVRPEYASRKSKKTGKTTSAGYHAHLVEFGTKPRKLKKPRVVDFGGDHPVTITHTGAMPAQPFLRPAWRASRTRMARLARVNLWRLVRTKARAA